MQVPPLGLPVGGTLPTAPARAAGDPTRTEPLDTLDWLLQDAPRQTRRLDSSPPAPPIPGPLGPVLERIASAGYSFSLGSEQPIESRQLAAQLEQGPADELLGKLAVSKPLPLPTSGLLPGALNPIPVEKACVGDWAGLRRLDSLTGQPEEPLARDLLELEKAGCRLLLAGADYEGPGDGLLHRKVMVIDTADPSLPEPAGAFQVLQTPEKTLWIQPFGVNQPMRLENLDQPRFFILGQSVPALRADPLACQLRELEAQGVQFGVPSRGNLNALYTGPALLGAMGAYRHQGPVELRLRGVGLATVERGQDGKLALSPELLETLAYPLKDSCEPALLKVLALPMGLGTGEKRALVERLEKGGIPLASAVSNSWGLARDDSPAFHALQGLSRHRQHPMEQLVDQVVGLNRDQAVSCAWAVDAAPHLIDHPEDRERLVALAGLGGDFPGCLAADTMLRASDLPYSEGFQALKSLIEQDVRKTSPSHFDPFILTVTTADSKQKSFQKARQTLERLLSERDPALAFEQDLSLSAGLVKRFDLHQGFELRRKLRDLPGGMEDKVDRLLREHRLSGEADQALLCLQPGGHPDLPEPLEVREQAARLVGHEVAPPQYANAFYVPESQTINFGASPPEQSSPYKFLLGLPDRNLLEDARLYSELLPCLDRQLVRTVMKDFKSGRLGRLSAAELTERLQVEAALLGPGQEAYRSFQEGQPDFAGRKALLAKMEGRFGDIPATCRAIQIALPPQTSTDDALDGLARMHQVLDPDGDAARTRGHFLELVEAVREGPWQGQSLREGVDRFLQLWSLGGIEKASKALATPPAEGGFVAGVRADPSGVTVGGVRLRTRS